MLKADQAGAVVTAWGGGHLPSSLGTEGAFVGGRLPAVCVCRGLVSGPPETHSTPCSPPPLLKPPTAGSRLLLPTQVEVEWRSG